MRTCFEENGFEDVSTYIQSGNILFKSEETQNEKLEETLEAVLSKDFNYKSRVLVRSYPQMEIILQQVPDEWKDDHDLRCYIAFIKEPTTAKQAMMEVEVREGIDSIKAGNGVLYLSTLMSGLTRSRFSRLVGKSIYQEMTIRNYNTIRKIAKLMGEGKHQDRGRETEDPGRPLVR